VDYLSLGPVPAEEECAQVGQPDYYSKARAECRRHIELLRKHFGPEPEGARLRVTSNPHDFGDYLDVVIEYDPSVREAVAYALRVERQAPSRWEE
jgi:hypothetical protein